MLASASRVEAKIQRSRENAERIQQLHKEYVKSERMVRKLEQMVKRTPRSFQAATHLEQLAQKNGVRIDSIKNLAPKDHDLYRETQVSLSVKQITLRTLINFLYEIENSRELLRINALQVKPDFQGPNSVECKLLCIYISFEGRSMKFTQTKNS